MRLRSTSLAVQPSDGSVTDQSLQIQPTVGCLVPVDAAPKGGVVEVLDKQGKTHGFRTYEQATAERKAAADAKEASLLSDAPFSLPRDHRISETLDTGSVEQASMDKPIPENNRGFKLLLKMGWTAGAGLGTKGGGRKEPVRIEMHGGNLGLGKATEYSEMGEAAAAERRRVFESELTVEEKALAAEKLETAESRAELLKQVALKSHMSCCDELRAHD